MSEYFMLSCMLGAILAQYDYSLGEIMTNQARDENIMRELVERLRRTDESEVAAVIIETVERMQMVNATTNKQLN